MSMNDYDPDTGMRREPVSRLSGRELTAAREKATKERYAVLNRLREVREAVKAGKCVYQTVEGDPAIRICVTHNPDFGLYGDEWCEHDREGK